MDAQILASQALPETTAVGGSDGTSRSVDWVLIPPRPRNAFWTICLFTLGRDPAAVLDGTGHLHLTVPPSGRPGWQLVTRAGHEDKPFGCTTLLPLVRLGLLDPVQASDRRLVVSAGAGDVAAFP